MEEVGDEVLEEATTSVLVTLNNLFLLGSGGRVLSENQGGDSDGSDGLDLHCNGADGALNIRETPVFILSQALVLDLVDNSPR